MVLVFCFSVPIVHCLPLLSSKPYSPVRFLWRTTRRRTSRSRLRFAVRSAPTTTTFSSGCDCKSFGAGEVPTFTVGIFWQKKRVRIRFGSRVNVFRAECKHFPAKFAEVVSDFRAQFKSPGDYDAAWRNAPGRVLQSCCVGNCCS